VLIGMPRLQKRLACYAQLYSRVGFVHQFQPLSGKELQGVIEHQWVQLGLNMTDDQPVDAAVFNAIARVTGGNFRLVQRLFAQIERIVSINNLPAVTTEVVTLARERLVEGATGLVFACRCNGNDQNRRVAGARAGPGTWTSPGVAAGILAARRGRVSAARKWYATQSETTGPIAGTGENGVGFGNSVRIVTIDYVPPGS
jgi:hypothetical protein